MSWYRTGTVAVTNGSKNVTGTGTLWASSVNAGDAFALVDANLNPTGAWYEVETVTSNTAIVLKQSYAGTTGSNKQYAVFNLVGNMTTPSFAQRLAQFFDSFQGLIDQPTTTPTASSIPIAGSGGTLAAGWLPAATDAVKGAVELATAAEATAGNDTTRAITPSVSGSRITFATTSTDDATSATAAPLKSAGGLAVAERAFIGKSAYIQGVGIGGAAISSLSPAQGETTITFVYTGSFSSKIEITGYANSAAASFVAEYLICGTGANDNQTTIKEVVKLESGFSMLSGGLAYSSNRTYTVKVANIGFGSGRNIYVRVFGMQPTITFTHV